MVVAPGFIDLHQHAHDAAAYRVEVLDGTTTALELEEGTVNIDGWYDARAGCLSRVECSRPDPVIPIAAFARSRYPTI